MLGGSSKVQWDTLPFQPPKPTDEIFVEGGDEEQYPGVLLGFYWEIPSWVFPKNRGTPKWMVYNGNPLLKWMIWGYPYFWKLPVVSLNFANSPFPWLNLKEELPEADPENVNPVAWFKQFDIKAIGTYK